MGGVGGGASRTGKVFGDPLIILCYGTYLKHSFKVQNIST